MRWRGTAIGRWSERLRLAAGSALPRNAPLRCARSGLPIARRACAHASWSHRDAQALVAALRAGTARMAAMLEAQQPEALTAIVADIAANAERYRNAEGLALPIAAVIASGVRR